ncbi:MAG: hypothetical protein ACKV2T_10835, partial [Kofleriaceae bacterium]
HCAHESWPPTHGNHSPLIAMTRAQIWRDLIVVGWRDVIVAEQLDANPILLTLDAAIESKPVLGTDGAGANLIAYVKSTDNTVCIRAFTTCP